MDPCTQNGAAVEVAGCSAIPRCGWRRLECMYCNAASPVETATIGTLGGTAL